MVGRIVVEFAGGHRLPRVVWERVAGLSLPTLYVPWSRRDWVLRRRLTRGLGLLAGLSVKRLLAEDGFEYWDFVESHGFAPVDVGPFLQAMAPTLALSALSQAGILPAEATVKLQTDRADFGFYTAAVALSAAVRHIGIFARSGGAELEDYLRRERGIAVLPRGAAADVTLLFAPGEREAAGQTLCLCGPVPDLGGLTLRAPGADLPGEGQSLGLQAVLWETGMLDRGCLAISGKTT